MSRELRVHSVPTRAEQIRTAVEIIAILAAGLWALYTFVYEQRIKPLAETPEFSLPTIVDQGPTIDGVAFLTIHKRLENTGNVPVDVAAESLTVFGEKVGPHTGHVERNVSPIFAEIRADVPRQQGAVLFSIAKLRSGAIGGATNFFTPAHASQDATFLVAVPVKTYPIILIQRKDYVAKAPITQQIPVRIIRTPQGAYALRSSVLDGEYDNRIEYPIRL